MLRDLQQYSKTLSDADFSAGVDQTFTTVLSSGEEVPLCAGGESVQVTKDNVDDFVAKVLEARKNEAAEQIKAIREGFLIVIKGKTSILELSNWQTMESRCTGDKHISEERLKSITSYPNCEKTHQIVDRFWRVFESFSDVERSAYLKFVWGRSRLPMSLDNLAYKHEVRLIAGMDSSAFP